MAISKQAIEQFFDAYAARLNAAVSPTPTVDIETAANAFTECFIEASPLGVACGKNDESFRAQIPKGFEFYRSIGTQGMTIKQRAITQLDDFHAMVKVRWHADYKKQDGSAVAVDFDVIYFLQMLTDEPHIFAYISGDEQKLYEEMGLVPQQADKPA